MFLQETHFRKEEKKYFQTLFKRQNFHEPATSKTKGVFNNINEQLDFKPNKVISDTDGMFLVITGLLEGKLVLLGNIYAPNIKQKQHYFQKIIKILASAFINDGISQQMNTCPWAPRIFYF